MITVHFFEEKSGVRISGHSGYANEGSDIVCASVSSAVYMVANTLTEVIDADVDIKVNDAFLELSLRTTTSYTDMLIDGLYLHLNQLSGQYPQYIVIK